MALLQISEPGKSAQPHARNLAAGIDLGTTNSLVATVRSGKVDTLPDEGGLHLLPSVVRYTEEHSVIVGLDAKMAAPLDPYNTISSVKRFMGRGSEDIGKNSELIHYRFSEQNFSVPRIKTDYSNVSAVEVSAEILRTLKMRSEKTLGGELAGAVITVPAYFDDAQRQATKDAAKLADLNVFRLLNEPTAAAVAYGLDKKAEGIHVVYDFGGGTFDVSILRLNRGVFEVMATAGNSSLGGDDIDEAVMQWLIKEAEIVDTNDQKLMRYLSQVVCDAKEELSIKQEVQLIVDFEGTPNWQVTLTRSMFHDLVDPLIKKTLLPCKRCIRDAGIKVADIEDVVMVGGSTRIPRVRELVGEFFQCDPLIDIDPDKVVAIGAALQADLLAGNNPDDDMLLLDVIPLSLGIETMGGLVEKVINRNTTIPVTKAQDFTTFKDGQTAMSVHIVQGERELVSDCRSLAKFELRGIPPMVAGAARIRVTYQIDADGLLSVSAQESSTGVESSVVVKPSYGLDDSEIETMIRDSMEFAHKDVAARKLREQQVEAERVILALEQALAEDGEELLDDEEISALNVGMDHLKITLNGENHLAIKEAIDSLNAGSTEFAARRMNTSIRNAMSGHKIEEFGK